MSNDSNDTSPALGANEMWRRSTIFAVAAVAEKWKLSAQGRKNIGPLAGKIEFERKVRIYKQEKPHKIMKTLKDIVAKKPKERTAEDVLELCALTQLISTYFSKHSVAAKKIVCQTIRLVEYRAGNVICRQGEKGDAFHIIMSGSVEVLIKDTDSGDPIVVSTLQKGQTFGDMALQANAPRSATCRAKSALELLTVDKETFLAVAVRQGGLFEAQTVKFFRNNVKAFQSIEESDLRALCKYAGRVKFNENFVFNLDKGELVFIIISGEVSLRHQHPDKSFKELTSLTSGAVFGQSGAVFGQSGIIKEIQYGWRAVTVTPCELYQINSKHVADLKNKAGVLMTLQSEAEFMAMYFSGRHGLSAPQAPKDPTQGNEERKAPLKRGATSVGRSSIMGHTALRGEDSSSTVGSKHGAGSRHYGSPEPDSSLHRTHSVAVMTTSDGHMELPSISPPERKSSRAKRNTALLSKSSTCLPEISNRRGRHSRAPYIGVT
ncbi:hypothetical protein CYMTET_48561 [Cymbomonas tetramitiformis]|uniref:Cyclic nucleotide-binding domain-containing protein n=1 Tax=Cymbomonas tetramitiformis TaxID=36881 RepID=A0AAE0EVM6_9CHLO|nr:hypothetical protein CYMTET_48561 [Cymbomonas tetramitiformis]